MEAICTQSFSLQRETSLQSVRHTIQLIRLRKQQGKFEGNRKTAFLMLAESGT
jgi:hypothetical protein